MKTINQVEIVPEFVLYIPDVEQMKQGVLYISIRYKTANHLCLCGCGEQTITPLNESGWKLSVNQSDGKVSLSPSIGNYNFNCKSHYIITNNKANFV